MNVIRGVLTLCPVVVREEATTNTLFGSIDDIVYIGCVFDLV